MIRVGLLGYGYWGRQLARVFDELDGTQVVAIADPAADARGEATRRFRGVAIAADPCAVTDDPGVDAVVIATPLASHAELAERALRQRKHVLVEKPIAATAADARALAAIARDCARVLMVDHTYVYSEPVRALKSVLESGELGELLYYDSVRVNLGRFRPDADALWDLGVHDLACLDYLLGTQPLRVTATGRAHTALDRHSLCYVTLHYPGRLIAHVNVNWLSPIKIRRVMLGGVRQLAVIDELDPVAPVKIFEGAPAQVESPEAIREGRVSYRTGAIHMPRLRLVEPLASMARHFLDCICDGTTPLSDGVCAARVITVLEAASRSLAAGGWPVALDAGGGQ
jgi:predicted dehydrogenase